MPVDLKPFRGILMLRSKISGVHAGILNDSRLTNALFQFTFRRDATLFISEVKDTRGTSKREVRKHAPAKAAREYSLRIVVHGDWDDKEILGRLLSNAGSFLKHPCVTEVIPGTRYDNPHYLLRPGAEMPRLKHLHLDIADDSPTQTEPGDEISKSRFLRIFDTAEADGNDVIVNASPSPRLRSSLMRYDTYFNVSWMITDPSKIDIKLQH